MHFQNLQRQPTFQPGTGNPNGAPVPVFFYPPNLAMNGNGAPMMMPPPPPFGRFPTGQPGTGGNRGGKTGFVSYGQGRRPTGKGQGNNNNNNNNRPRQMEGNRGGQNNFKMTSVTTSSPSMESPDSIQPKVSQVMDKNTIGDNLFVDIESILISSHPNEASFAGKITGMLLEACDMTELLQLIQNRSMLTAKVNEAVEVLKQFQVTSNVVQQHSSVPTQVPVAN